MLDIDRLVNKAGLSVILEAALDAIQRNKIKLLLDGGAFLFFFDFNDDVFGGNEQSRVMFAKMKDPNDEDNSPGWLKEANFTAVSLNKMCQGVQQQTIFYQKDLDQIQVLTKEIALARLEEFFEKQKTNSPEDKRGS